MTRWAALAGALVLLNLSLTFVSVWPTLAVRPSPRVSIEACLLVLGLAFAHRVSGGPVSARTGRLLALGWTVLVAGYYLEITTRSLYGRSVNLYWDLRLLPDVGSMFAYVARPLGLAGLAVAVVAVPVLLYLPLRWAIARVSAACGHPAMGRAAIAVALAGLAVGGAAAAGSRLAAPFAFAPPVSWAFAREAAELAHEVSGAGRRPLPPAADVGSDLAQVRGADVIVLFLESYGTTSWDRAEFREALAAPRASLEAAIAETQRAVVTARVESTTFGGESWLAHISLLSGTEVRDEDVNRRLMAERRDTMVTTFARAGYRTVAVMPGLQAPWPEGAFYGFDAIYGVADLGYAGPSFGWWDVTDQFVIARMDAMAVAPGPRAPVFVFLPSISTHAPFMPVPPYQPDWARLLTPTPYDHDDVMRAYLEVPDWTNLGPGYAQALAYAHRTIAGYLRLRADRDLVLVLVGDHQPPALVSGEGASWDVPVHVVTGRPLVLESLRARGFQDGLSPGRPALARMDALLPILLGAFGSPR